MKKDILSEISKEYVNKSNNKNIEIENDSEILKHTIDMDIRENIPSQLMSLVSKVVEIIEVLEDGDENESKKK